MTPIKPLMMNPYERFVVAHHFSSYPEDLSYDEIQALLKGDLDNGYEWCLWQVYERENTEDVIRYMDEMLFTLRSLFKRKKMDE